MEYLDQSQPVFEAGQQVQEPQQAQPPQWHMPIRTQTQTQTQTFLPPSQLDTWPCPPIVPDQLANFNSFPAHLPSQIDQCLSDSTAYLDFDTNNIQCVDQIQPLQQFLSPPQLHSQFAPMNQEYPSTAFQLPPTTLQLAPDLATSIGDQSFARGDALSTGAALPVIPSPDYVATPNFNYGFVGPDDSAQASPSCSLNGCSYHPDWRAQELTPEKKQASTKDGSVDRFDRRQEVLQSFGYAPAFILDSGQKISKLEKRGDDIVPDGWLNSGIQQIPPHAQLRPLIDKFFSHSFVHCPIVSKQWIYDNYRDWTKARASHSPPPSNRVTCLLLRVLACAAQYTNQKLSVFFQTTSDNLESIRDVCIPQLQAIMLKCLWNRRQGHLSDSLSHLRQAYDMAIQLGVHQADCIKNSCPMQLDIMRRIWWTMVLWDWEISQVLRRPKIIDTNQCFIVAPFVPLDQETESWENYMLLAMDLQQCIRASEKGFATNSVTAQAWEGHFGDKKIKASTEPLETPYIFYRKYLEVLKLMALVATSPVQFYQDPTTTNVKTLQKLVKSIISLINLADESEECARHLLHFLFSSALRLYNNARFCKDEHRVEVPQIIRNARDVLWQRYMLNMSGLSWVSALVDSLGKIIGPDKEEEATSQSGKRALEEKQSSLSSQPAKRRAVETENTGAHHEEDAGPVLEDMVASKARSRSGIGPQGVGGGGFMRWRIR